MPYKIVKVGERFRLKKPDGSLIKNQFKTKENAEKVANLWEKFEKKKK
jgi:hypothetical protein